MLLAIDTGNTNIVFSVFDDDGNNRGEWRSSTDTNRTADEFAIWLSQLMEMEGVTRRDISAAIISSVVPAMLFSLRNLCRKYFGCEAEVVGAPGVELGIERLVDQPDEVGADRVVNAVAAKERYGGPAIIIDFGTATTCDVIDTDGNYIGGAIAPGINLSLEALHQAAAKLPRVAIGRPGRTIGKNTAECMRSGIFWGYVGMIEGIVERIRHEYADEVGEQAEMQVIATGGLAPLFLEGTDIIDVADPDLTLHGLLLIHRLNSADG